MTRFVLGALACLAAAIEGCGSSAAVPCEGSLGCACYPNGTCGEGLSCSSNACVMLRPPAGSTSSARPPAAGHAMSSGHAGAAGSTVVAGSAGPRSSSGGAGIGSAGAPSSIGGMLAGIADAGVNNGGSCAPAGAVCGSTTCCGASPCVQSVCAADCVHNGDCISGCCFTLNTGESVCAPTRVCAPPDASSPAADASTLAHDASMCAAAGADCATTSCCGGALCVQNVCANSCAANSACASNCCFESLCAPSNLCVLPDAGAAIGGGAQCSGTTPLPPLAAVDTHIDGQFDGWQGNTVFWLQDGQLWQQTSYAYVYQYAYSPSVNIAPDNGSYRMTVDGVSSSITVGLLDIVVESQIVSTFMGWKNGAMFELANGQVWQQTDATTLVQVETRPDAAVFCDGGFFLMTVKGIDSAVQVTQLK